MFPFLTGRPVAGRFVFLLLLLLLGACATPSRPLTGIVPGRQVETLQAGVSMSVHTVDKNSGGRGVLVFRAPDRFHLAVLAPFGLTIMEVFVDGEQLTWLFPGKSLAYQGTFADLPAREGMRTWGLMRWVVEPPPVPGPSEMREFTRPDGSRERVYFDRQGLVQRKENDAGDEVVYREYQVVNGIPFPQEIELANQEGDRVRLTFEEPELNQPVEDAALLPNLSGVKVLPFSAFQGF